MRNGRSHEVGNARGVVEIARDDPRKAFGRCIEVADPSEEFIAAARSDRIVTRLQACIAR